MISATENQIRALKIIKENPNISGYWFSVKMWPDNEMHKKSWKTINRNGLYYMYKLERRGFVTVDNYLFTITELGLKQIENEN